MNLRNVSWWTHYGWLFLRENINMKNPSFQFLKKETYRYFRYNAWVKVKVTQSCLTLCDPMNYTVHEILQTRTLEWVSFPFSRGSYQGSNSGLLHCGWILYHLSHKESPKSKYIYINIMIKVCPASGKHL